MTVKQITNEKREAPRVGVSPFFVIIFDVGACDQVWSRVGVEARI